MQESLERITKQTQLLRTVIDSTPDLIFAKDHTFRYILVNQGYANAIGKTVEAMVGKDDLEVGYHEDLVLGNPEKGMHGFRLDDRMVLTGQAIHNPHDLVTLADGSLHIFDTLKVPLHDPKGETYAVLGFARDVTEQKQAEKALRQSEERLQAILDHSPAVVYLKDLQGRFLSVNRQFEALFQLSKTELVGKTNYEIFPHDIADRFQTNDQKVLEARNAIQSEEQAPHADGLHTYLSLKFPLLDSAGAPYALCGFSTDITDRKKAETVISQLAAIVESSEDAIFSKTLAGIISSWNRGAERLFGYTPAEAIGQHITLLIPPDRLDEEPQIIEKLKRGERIEPFETLRKRKDGTLVDISLTISPLKDPTGAIVGASKIARDISKQQMALRLRQQAEETLQKQTRLLNLILNSMSDGVVVANEQG